MYKKPGVLYTRTRDRPKRDRPRIGPPRLFLPLSCIPLPCIPRMPGAQRLPARDFNHSFLLSFQRRNERRVTSVTRWRLAATRPSTRLSTATCPASAWSPRRLTPRSASVARRRANAWLRARAPGFGLERLARRFQQGGRVVLRGGSSQRTSPQPIST